MKGQKEELTEERVREIVRKELAKWAKRQADFLAGTQPSRPGA